jgi:hypothetical protein
MRLLLCANECVCVCVCMRARVCVHECVCLCVYICRVQLKRDGTRWHTGGYWRGNWRMEWVASTLFTLPRNLEYPALLPLMRTPRLPVVDWTDTPANLNRLVCLAERQNLVSARVPSHFKCSLRPLVYMCNLDCFVMAGHWSQFIRLEYTCHCWIYHYCLAKLSFLSIWWLAGQK